MKTECPETGQIVLLPAGLHNRRRYCPQKGRLMSQIPVLCVPWESLVPPFEVSLRHIRVRPPWHNQICHPFVQQAGMGFDHCQGIVPSPFEVRAVQTFELIWPLPIPRLCRSITSARTSITLTTHLQSLHLQLHPTLLWPRPAVHIQVHHQRRRLCPAYHLNRKMNTRHVYQV